MPNIPFPSFLIKIIESRPPNPLPDAFPLSALDQKDGFIHLSTFEQTPKTASLYFSHFTTLFLLVIDTKRLELDGIFKWGDEGCVHLYGDDITKLLGRNTILKVVEWTRDHDKTWNQTCIPE